MTMAAERRWACLPALALLVLASAAPAFADDDDDDPVTVPPTDELILLDPGIDPEGKPRAVVNQDPHYPAVHVDVPPAAIVHRYYYTGDREFQGPFLPGGPTVLIANHPKTGERVSVQVQLPPGAPRVCYECDKIEYDFGRTVVTLHFGHLSKVGLVCEPHVLVRNRSEFSRSVSESRGHLRDWCERTGLPHAVRHVAKTSSEMASSSADRIHDAGEIVVAPVVRIWEATPLQGLLTSSAEEQASRGRDAAVQRVQAITSGLEGTIPTVR